MDIPKKAAHLPLGCPKSEKVSIHKRSNDPPPPLPPGPLATSLPKLQHASSDARTCLYPAAFQDVLRLQEELHKMEAFETMDLQHKQWALIRPLALLLVPMCMLITRSLIIEILMLGRYEGGEEEATRFELRLAHVQVASFARHSFAAAAPRVHRGIHLALGRSAPDGAEGIGFTIRLRIVP